MSLFVTGTDTGCGKTFVSAALLRRLGGAGIRALGMKPVATGAQRTPDGLVNDDVEALRLASNVSAPSAICNPYLFEPPCSPHIAAAKAGVVIDPAIIIDAYRECERRADVVIVEGVGGWMVPLSERLMVADLACELGLPTLLIVGVRLGCINHALLTANAIAAVGVPCLGWLANVMDDELYAVEEVIDTLKRRVSAPLLGVIDNRDQQALDGLAQELTAVARRAG
jgi:dethiobiotin synthetase